ncbi:YoaK family protein [uncultured Ramlibacter sp.]|uniref:YoaK family protein n=1 Tax=uncultured Ramlibacter sp. TaxID=260755 RepID=UPI002636A24F|nr:YoaK family protein [uncultured Ramlibacter sp.]
MIPAIRGWTAVERAPLANFRLGCALAFVAGAANAGGFLAVGQYTSHMTGAVSMVADHLVMGSVGMALAAAASVVAFVMGAATTAVLVNWGLRNGLFGAYCLPLALEAALLLVFGIFGAAIAAFPAFFAPVTVLLLCFLMGLQNAVITKISKAEIRTTHVTGLVTDIGIELGKALFVNWDTGKPGVAADRRKLHVHAWLAGCFFAGGLIGALGFKHLGYVATVPLALILAVLVARPIAQDLARRRAP